MIKRSPNDQWFQHEVFEGALILIPLCGVLYLLGQVLIGSSFIELTPTLGIIFGCLAIRAVNRWLGEGIAHGFFIIVILGLFIPSWMIGGGVLNPTRFFAAIFFSVHIVLFPHFRLIYIITLWMTFTLLSLTVEYSYPEWVIGQTQDQPASASVLIESAIVHLIIFMTCGILLRRTMDAFQNAKQRLQEANEIQSDLLRIISHDLRGPVNNLQLGVEALMTSTLNQMETSPDSMNHLVLKLGPMLKLQTQHMDFLIRNLSYFRLNHVEQLSPFLESTSLEELLSQVIQGWEIRAQRANINLSLQFSPMNVQVYTDRMFLKQILDNLISNALKYSPSQAQVLVLVQLNSEEIFIEVSDEGSGIPLEDQERVFKRFERAGNPDRPREHSIGLGLWIVSLLAPLIKGEVSIVNSSNKGSTFRLTLRDNSLSSIKKEAQESEGEESEGVVH